MLMLKIMLMSMTMRSIQNGAIGMQRPRRRRSAVNPTKANRLLKLEYGVKRILVPEDAGEPRQRPEWHGGSLTQRGGSLVIEEEGPLEV